jgi:hypothetical protein
MHVQVAYISEQNSEAEAVSWRSTEKYKKSACEDFMCDLNTLCVLQYSDIWSMTVTVPMLKSARRKWIVDVKE